MNALALSSVDGETERGIPRRHGGLDSIPRSRFSCFGKVGTKTGVKIFSGTTRNGSSDQGARVLLELRGL